MAEMPKSPGRPKGSVNRATQAVREAIAKAAEDCSPRIQQWLDEVDDPAKRMDLYLKMLEYHIPKLARTEVSGEIKGAFTVTLTADDAQL